MNPIISIIVPIYKVEEYLNRCIDSILAQSFTDFELILVDDGSPDACGEICDKYAEQDNRVKVIHKVNGGVSSARNTGINIAKGEFIGFVDPDDDIEPDMYNVLLLHALNRNADIVVCPINTMNLITNTISVSSVWENINSTLDKNTIIETIIPCILTKKTYSLLSCCNKLYRKSSCFELGYKFNDQSDHGEDVHLNLMLLTEINALAFVEKPLYNYYIRERDSLTQCFREDLYDYILDNKNFRLLLCNKYNLTQCIDDLINHYVITTMNYMQDVVNSKISINKKYNILTNLINDDDFHMNVVNCKSPSKYYILMKFICHKKNVKLFYQLVKAKKILQQNYIYKLVCKVRVKRERTETVEGNIKKIAETF